RKDHRRISMGSMVQLYRVGVSDQVARAGRAMEKAELVLKESCPLRQPGHSACVVVPQPRFSAVRPRRCPLSRYQKIHRY
ncbi:MAG: hypothetical protein WCD27_10090, partial [Candidatus Acidiferrales bacterium]